MFKVILETNSADDEFVSDLRLALWRFHGRLAKLIGTTGNMLTDSQLAALLLSVQTAYDQIKVP